MGIAVVRVPTIEMAPGTPVVVPQGCSVVVVVMPENSVEIVAEGGVALAGRHVVVGTLDGRVVVLVALPDLTECMREGTRALGEGDRLAHSCDTHRELAVLFGVTPRTSEVDLRCSTRAPVPRSGEADDVTEGGTGGLPSGDCGDQVCDPDFDLGKDGDRGDMGTPPPRSIVCRGDEGVRGYCGGT